MATRDILYAAAGGGAAPTYIEDVFSTYLYTGNSSTQTITNGIDLAGKGGLVWQKVRNTAGYDHVLTDTTTSGTGSLTNYLSSNTTNSFSSNQGNIIGSYNSNGFTLNSGSGINNVSGTTNVSWTFRKQPKFFDVVTYTGTGSMGATVNHNLGSVPGMIIVKRTSVGGTNWAVYHRSLGNDKIILLNTTAASVTDNWWNDTTPTSTQFFLSSDPTVNAFGDTFVAYLFAHNAGGFGAAGTDNIISCGSLTTDGSGNSSLVNLGYEPQYIMLKRSDGAQNWLVFDVMRGLSLTETADLYPNLSNAENLVTPARIELSATGFKIANSTLSASATYIYMAIRRGPMKTPTSGTSVFSPIISSASVNTKLTTGFPVDSQWGALRNGDSDNFQVIDRLRKISTTTTENNGSYLRTSTTNAESTATTSRSNFWDNTGFRMFSSWEGGNTLFYNFRRAPGFFDTVCFDADTANTSAIAHNLTVTPELVICKKRSGTSNWITLSKESYSNYLALNTTAAFASGLSWSATSTTVDLSAVAGTGTHVAYLFASIAGVSKVGSYTGTGATQTINAGLPTGARFVLIKRTDSTGDWWVWDTARGMVAGTDPRLATNDGLVGIGEINENWVYTVTNGFQIVTSDATVNASGGSYIYLAIA